MGSDEENPTYLQSTLLSALRSQRSRKRLRKAGGSVSESDIANVTADAELDDFGDERIDGDPTPAPRNSENLGAEQSQLDCLNVVSDGEEISCDTTCEKKTKFRKTMVDLISIESDFSRIWSDPLLEGVEKEHFGNDSSPILFDSEQETFKGCENKGFKEISDGKNDYFTETEKESNEHRDEGTSNREEAEKKKATKRKGRDQIPTKISKQEKQKVLLELRAESQRLLRESGNVAFKPARMVRKSVSSVLDKIRKRKEDTVKPSEDTQIDQAADKDIHKKIEMESHDPTIDVATDSDDKKFVEVPKEDPEPPKNIENHSTEDESEIIIEEGIMEPSILLNNLKNYSTKGEQSDDTKERAENCGIARQSSPVGLCFAKDFFDDEAEEEPDSDNDNLTLDDDDEDQCNGLDELNDLIATNLEEDSADKEILDELHQKWLEQQDEAGTEKLLHKLSHNNAKRERSPSEEDVSQSDACDDESHPIPPSNARSNLKKVKEMFHLLYTDTNDVYVSSDEEDEATVVLESFQERATLETPKLEGENLRIKKTNVVEKKKKPDNNFSNTSISLIGLKTSFLGREAKVVSSLQRSGSSTARSFIFERDANVPSSGTNNRSATMGGTQNVSLRRALEIYKRDESTKMGPSLHEILKWSNEKMSAASSECSSEEVRALYASLAVSRYSRKQPTAIP